MEHNNEHIELEQMREQISLLREKLKQQEIVNEHAIVKSMKLSVRSINRWGLWHSIFGLLAVPFCCVIFAQMGLTDGFVWGTGIMLVVCWLVTIYAHLGLNLLNVSRENLVQVGLKTMRLRRIYKSWYYIAVPMILIWGYFLYKELSMLVSDVQHLRWLLLSALIGGLIGGAIGFRMHYRTIHDADEVLDYLQELKNFRE